jgi:hypothetical protein
MKISNNTCKCEIHVSWQRILSRLSTSAPQRYHNVIVYAYNSQTRMLVYYLFCYISCFLRLLFYVLLYEKMKPKFLNMLYQAFPMFAFVYFFVLRCFLRFTCSPHLFTFFSTLHIIATNYAQTNAKHNKPPPPPQKKRSNFSCLLVAFFVLRCLFFFIFYFNS